MTHIRRYGFGRVWTYMYIGLMSHISFVKHILHVYIRGENTSYILSNTYMRHKSQYFFNNPMASIHWRDTVLWV